MISDDVVDKCKYKLGYKIIRICSIFFSNHSIQMLILSRKVNKHVFIWMYDNDLVVSSARNE